MSKEVWKPGTLLAPVPPVLVTVRSGEAENVLTVGWTGIVCTHPAMLSISLRPERFSTPLLTESGVFAVNLVTESMVRAADFCGVRSGRDVNKFEAAHLTPVPASSIPCPILRESPLSLECRVTQTIPLGSHILFLAEITAVDVDDTLIDEAGRLCLERAKLVAYSHGSYRALGRELGTFGYSVKKKKR